MTFVYTTIGRLVVYVIRRRFGRQLRVVGGVALAGAVLGGAVGAYLLALRVVAPGLGGELLGLLRAARRRPVHKLDVEGDEELLEDEGGPMLPG